MLKGKRFYIIIALVAILLIALIAIQVYWVRNTSRLQQADLAKKMNGALHKAIENTEDITHAFYLYSRTYIQPGQGVSMIKKDSNAMVIDTVQLFNIFPYHNKPDTCFYATNTSYYEAPVIVNATFRFEYIHSPEIPDIPQKNKSLSDLSFNNFRQKLDEDLPIASRIKTRKLDSMIGVQLYKAGINAAYAYGLRKKGELPFEYISDSLFINKKNVLTFNALLFDDIAYTKPYELVLFVDDRESYISKALAGALGISSCIILLLAAAFIYFAYTVLRQKKLSQMKTDFINNMTHEFMTPVTNIALALETLERTKDQEKEKKILDVISSENTLLKDNINKVLQVAILDKGEILLNPSSININDLLRRIAKNFALQIASRYGRISYDLNATDPIIIADETHITNLFYNIIDNAVKYASDEPIAIMISSGSTGNKLWVSITDNGIGMEAATQKNIFEKFYRGSTGDKHDVKGFGLGLSYVKSIADAHKISLQVESTIGKGTTFTIGFNKQ